MNAKKSKLVEQFSKEASEQILDRNLGIFHNVAIFVNGYTGNFIPLSFQLIKVIVSVILFRFHFSLLK